MGKAWIAAGSVARQFLAVRRARCAARPAVKIAPKTADAERAADRAEERGARGRDAEIGVVDRVLHRDDQHLHDHAEPEAEHEHVAAARQVLGVRVERREQRAGRAVIDRRAGDRERPCSGPVRLMIWPEAIEVTSMPTIIGSSCSPDAVGRTPLHDLEESGR